MNLISTKTHAILDYTVGILLIAAPWIFSFNDGSAAHWVPVVNGITVLIVSAFTNYEGGFIRTIPMKGHLTIDVLAGIILALSPWLLGFADRLFVPHLLIGIFEIIVGLMTSRVPFVVGKRMPVSTVHHT